MNRPFTWLCAMFLGLFVGCGGSINKVVDKGKGAEQRFSQDAKSGVDKVDPTDDDDNAPTPDGSAAGGAPAEEAGAVGEPAETEAPE